MKRNKIIQSNLSKQCFTYIYFPINQNNNDFLIELHLFRINNIVSYLIKLYTYCTALINRCKEIVLIKLNCLLNCFFLFHKFLSFVIKMYM